jgi:anti-sigma regulatory factor (Ser/Thr protein kinase)
MPESITFPCRPEFVAIARHAVRTFLGQFPEAVVENSQLIASEFVTNSLLWSLSGVDGQPIELAIDHEPGSKTLRLEVVDAGPRPAQPGDEVDPDQHGRGLLIASRLSAKCGHDAAKGRQVWWAELSW